MALAYLGYSTDGPSLSFRVDPEEIEWNFRVNTKVFNTIGGRVIQVLGGTLGDMTITGSIGEERILAGHNDAGKSWKLHQFFVNRIREIMEFQSQDATIHHAASQMMHRPCRFIYPPKDWNFEVYVKSLADPEGGSFTHKVGRSNHKYMLTLFIVEPDSSRIREIRDEAIDGYMNRISEGMGWRYSEYNGSGWENLDPYSDTWGEDLDLSSISGDPVTGGGGYEEDPADMGEDPGPGE